MNVKAGGVGPRLISGDRYELKLPEGAQVFDGVQIRNAVDLRVRSILVEVEGLGLIPYVQSDAQFENLSRSVPSSPRASKASCGPRQGILEAAGRALRSFAGKWIRGWRTTRTVSKAKCLCGPDRFLAAGSPHRSRIALNVEIRFI